MPTQTSPRRTTPAPAPAPAAPTPLTITAQDIRRTIGTAGTVLVAYPATGAVLVLADFAHRGEGHLLIGDGDDLRSGYLTAPVPTIDAYALRLTMQLRATYGNEA